MISGNVFEIASNRGSHCFKLLQSVDVTIRAKPDIVNIVFKDYHDHHNRDQYRKCFSMSDIFINSWLNPKPASLTWQA